MVFNRIWAMPNHKTFDIKPIKELIEKWLDSEGGVSIDPFSNSNKLATITNDLDPESNAEYCMDALDFLRMQKNSSIDVVLFDPPYSPRQVSECYKKLGKTVNMQTTQSSFWSKMKIEIARCLKPTGVCISFGWNTNGVGKTRGFVIEEILLVPHGGAHNDTICLVERKV